MTSLKPADPTSGIPGQRKVWYAPNKFEAYGDEEIEAVTQCLKDGWLAPGPRTAEFERQIAARFGKKLGLMVNSGSSANIVALKIAGVDEGVEVVTPALTFSTTVAPLVQMRAKIVFCDVIPDRYVPSVDQVMDVVTENTKVIFIPNLVGNNIDWAELRKRIAGRDIVLVEDSADTIVHTESTDISTTSFYASHVITAGGGGGMVMMNSQERLDLALQYRDWGRIGNNSEDVSERFGHDVDGIKYDFKFLYGVLGYNFKSTEMNAAFGLIQIGKLKKFEEKRRALVDRYLELLKDTEYVLPDDSQRPNWLAFPLQIRNGRRMALLQFLEDHDIQTRVCFAGNITRHPAYRGFLAEYPQADLTMSDAFLVGAHHGLEIADVDRVCAVLKEFSKVHPQQA